MATVADYNALMRDLPLNELMAATDLDGIGNEKYCSQTCQTADFSSANALVAVFSHLHKKIRSTKYPTSRMLSFLEAISKDVASQILKVR